MIQFLRITLLFSGLLWFITSCNDDDIITGADAQLSYSSDTVYFDTLFTNQNTPTYRLMVYNNNDGIMVISQINLGKGTGSDFQLNVNGISSNVVNDIQIQPGDSMFIFVKAKLNENNCDTTVERIETIEFHYNTNTDQIAIVAWAQDAQRVSAKEIETQTWSSAKPYIITDSLVVKEGHTLTINQGVRIYLHNEANILVKGSLKVNGTLQQPVLFASDRMEFRYKAIPGQWGSIIFDSTSTGNSITYAEIYHATNALYSKATMQKPIDIALANTKIVNCGYSGIHAINSNITAYNIIVSNCAEHCLFLEGGNYALYHATIANINFNYGGYQPIIKLSNRADDETQTRLPLSFECSNSIIYHGNSEYVEFNKNDIPNDFTCTFDYCLFDYEKSKFESVDTIHLGKNNIYYSRNSNRTLFELMGTFNYSLDSLSIAVDVANSEVSQLYPLDIQGYSRFADTLPDLGAMEYFYTNTDSK